MQLLARIVSKESLGLDLVRLAGCAIIFTHGFYRLTHGEVAGLAELLHDQGFPLALPLAYLITLNETIGMPLVALRMMVLPVCLMQCVVFSAGIILFNSHRGFFMVGAGEGGWEYNALLIVCFVATIWANRRGELFMPTAVQRPREETIEC